MKRIVIACIVLNSLLTTFAHAQTLNKDNVLRYIDRYRSLAMSEQQRTGIPAAVKLAQGIHETGAGSSELAANANNHFGLKCKAGWTGATYQYTDDAPNECFRKYNLDFESYQDHSNYLKNNPRYAALFELSITDYAGWAFALRKAGYATNPNYPQLLIKIIETYQLQQYTYAAMGDNSFAAPVAASQPVPQQQASRAVQQPVQQPVQNTVATNNKTRYRGDNNRVQAAPVTPPPVNAPVTAATPPPVASTPSPATASNNSYVETRSRQRQNARVAQQTRKVEEQQQTTLPPGGNTVVKINNLRAVYGKKGDMPLQYAVRNGIRYEKFLEMNDLKDEPLPGDMPLYLERKHFWGLRPMHLVKPHENMIMIAQAEGIQLKYLRDLNYMEEDEEPVPGITLELQAQAAEKPRVVKVEKKQYEDAPPANDYGQQGNTYNNPRYAAANTQGNYRQQQPLNSKDLASEIIGNAEDNSYTQDNSYVYTEEQQGTTEQYSSGESAPTSSEIFQRQYETQRLNASEVRVTPNPAQVYNEDKPLWDKLKDSKLGKKVSKLEEEVGGRFIETIPQKEPERRTETIQQPPPSYSQPQYTVNGVTPNPAAQVYPAEEEEKPTREERKEARRARKEKEEAEPVVQQVAQPEPQRPKTELDLLKEQFDQVIYSQNTPPATQQQQPVQRQQAPQQARQQPPRTDPPGTYYTVKQGDTAYTIAKKHNITVRQLMDWNGLDFDAIKEGQRLRVKQ